MAFKEPEIGTPDPIKAQYFAQIAHGTQLYNDELPYPFHLQRVVDVLRRFGYSGPEWECAGWLHDVIEDTNKSYSDILRRFGLVVAERVYAVTAAKGRNRKERNGPTYAAIKEKEEYIILKLADRIANLEYGLASPDGKVDMYRKEFPEFEKGIRFEDRSKEDPQVTRMWNTVKLLLGLPVS